MYSVQRSRMFVFVLAALVAVAVGAQAQVTEVLDFIGNNKDIADNFNTPEGPQATATAGLTWNAFIPGGTVNGQRIRTASGANPSGTLDFDTNRGTQSHIGSYAYTHFAPLANLGSISVDLDENDQQTASIRFLLRQSPDWYISSVVSYSTDKTLTVNTADLLWNQITDTAALDDLNQLIVFPTSTIPAPGTGGSSLPANFAGDGGGFYVEDGGKNADRPRIGSVTWDVAITINDVPDTSWMTSSAAQGAITAAGFNPVVVPAVPEAPVVSELVPAGSVISSYPNGLGGSNAKAGSDVTIRVVENFRDGFYYKGGDLALGDLASWDAQGVNAPTAFNQDVDGGQFWMFEPGTATLDSGDVVFAELHMNNGVDIVMTGGTMTQASRLDADIGKGYAAGSATFTITGGVATLHALNIGNWNDLAGSANSAMGGNGSGDGTLIVGGTGEVIARRSVAIGDSHGGTGKLVMQGSTAKFSTERDFRIRGTNTTLRWEADAAGFSTIAAGTKPSTGGYAVWLQGKIEIDTLAYTGGAGEWNLMTVGTKGTGQHLAYVDVLNADTVPNANAALPEGWVLTLNDQLGDTDTNVLVLSYDGSAPASPFGTGEPAKGMPVAGAIGLGIVAAACALGGSMFLRKK